MKIYRVMTASGRDISVSSYEPVMENGCWSFRDNAGVRLLMASSDVLRIERVDEAQPDGKPAAMAA